MSPGNTVGDLGHTIFNQPFLGSREHGGFLYIQPTFQCTQRLILPDPPYVVGVLLQKWETPWAKVFPIRLMLRLGAEFRCELEVLCIMFVKLCQFRKHPWLESTQAYSGEGFITVYFTCSSV